LSIWNKNGFRLLIRADGVVAGLTAWRGLTNKKRMLDYHIEMLKDIGKIITEKIKEYITRIR
jgi:hypothetical protein